MLNRVGFKLKFRARKEKQTRDKMVNGFNNWSSKIDMPNDGVAGAIHSGNFEG